MRKGIATFFILGVEAVAVAIAPLTVLIMITIVLGIWSAWLYRIEMQKGFSWCISRSIPYPIMAAWSRIRYGTAPIAKVPELEHCLDALIEYSGIRAERVISAAEIAASNAALAPLYAVCKILDDQQIPHPKVDNGIVLLGSAEWIDFLARVLAVRHDLEQARRVYLSMI